MKVKTISRTAVSLSPSLSLSGGVAEWSIATVLKTVVQETAPGVRIPPPPPFWSEREAGKGNAELRLGEVGLEWDAELLFGVIGEDLERAER